MADDSVEIEEPFPFHPCDSPRGMYYYDFKFLTTSQQEKLNKLKRDTIRDDEQYLAANPEVFLNILYFISIIKHTKYSLFFPYCVNNLIKLSLFLILFKC